MGWRDEIAMALGEWINVEGGVGKQPRWQRIGRAARTGDAGQYAVDLRGSDIGPDQLDSLRLAGPENDGVETNGFVVSEMVQNGSLLSIRVAEFADVADPHLWMLKQPPTFLVEALRDGISGLGEHPLAAALAAGRLGGAPAHAADPPGFHPAQSDAYRACLGEGIYLVWGPPGTGKTTVLKRAIGDLITRGDRVLLVSATNIAVDNALLGVVRAKQHSPGDIVRVGPPHLRDVAEDASVSLPLMVKARLADTAARRSTLETELVEIKQRAEQLATLDGGLSGFDSAAYFAALKLLRTPGEDLASARARCEAADRRLADSERAYRDALSAAETAAARDKAAEPSRAQWREVDRLSEEAVQVRKAAEHREAAALLAEGACDSLRQELAGIEGKGAVKKWRLREKSGELQRQLGDAEQAAASAKRSAAEARATATTHIEALDARIAALTDTIALTREQAADLAADVKARLAAEKDAGRHYDRCKEDKARAEKAAERAQQAGDLTKQAEQQDWPARFALAGRLRPAVVADTTRRPALEKQYQEAQEEYERLARDAQSEIIKDAKLVATTLARFRTNRAVFEGPYDVVLVDEAGAATLPEVLLATGKAGRAAVLLGDFMQLGAVIPPELKAHERSDIKRWLLPDVFQHCGIAEPADAQAHPACVTLTQQHRFGPAVMRLANGLAYGGVLTGGSRTQAARPADDPEIVLIDTDGLHELARAHLTGSRSGWWPAGSLIARALVELHRELGEETGIVTPYRVQSDATLEALRDVEGPGGGALAEVGTAHKFQGREFDIVVFDTVEGGAGSRELWMACAHLQPAASTWPRDGVRLFNVAVTRVKTRLYIIASGERVKNAKPGSPFAQLAALVDARRGVRVLQAKSLITPPTAPAAFRGEFGTALAEVLSRHVEVTEIDDERDFFRTFTEEIRHARHSLWVWAPWVAKRVSSLLPELRRAADRGVRIRVFIRDDTDQLQKKPANQKLIADLRSIVDVVVPMNVMHQKIAVIDERTVMLGSLNVLSQSWTREVMLTMRGAHFARKLLEHEHAAVFAAPPRCDRCRGKEIEIRRRQNGTWVWRCYALACKTTPKGGTNAWTQNIRLGRGR
ncbi:AAA domain-containing protein [Streptomyces rimosus]|uniref:AAA domain-containing protein n=1 Tax=Streptomyces rimosus TaxID=1927 RepID=UPI0004BFCE95|nr:AAA domain-containing protein [Streptomyces rimosus]